MSFGTPMQTPLDVKLRYENLKKRFEKAYSKSPDFFARAPGRVNVIGEHIDYCGYAVLPMAIEQDIAVAISPNSDAVLRLKNTNDKYPSYSCPVDDFHIDKTNPQWYHYFLCGYRGVIDHLKQPAARLGLDVLVDGRVPSCAGLSSSSALVCSAALATMTAHNTFLTRQEMAHLCQHCEYHIGTEGGGMDQSIAFLAEAGTAKLIEFKPIRATDVQLVDGAVFVISNSCADINKAATSHFNTRVAECRLATQVIAHHKGLDWRTTKRLGDLQQMLDVSLDQMLDIVATVLHAEPYTKAEVCKILGVTEQTLNDISLSEKTFSVGEFRLQARARHVFSEARRVLQFKAACDAPNANTPELLGTLMSESHRSCRLDYECSCTELDELVDLAMASGALGSRLTGAGWGGCAVSLVPADKVDTFLDKLKHGYYAKIEQRTQVKIGDALFSTEPGAGAEVYHL